MNNICAEAVDPAALAKDEKISFFLGDAGLQAVLFEYLPDPFGRLLLTFRRRY